MSSLLLKLEMNFFIMDNKVSSVAKAVNQEKFRKHFF